MQILNAPEQTDFFNEQKLWLAGCDHDLEENFSVNINEMMYNL